MDQNEMEKQATSLVGLIKNPVIKFTSYILLSMVIGIGLSWVILGVCSPVLLLLLIMKW
jgi:hypothetical protein